MAKEKKVNRNITISKAVHDTIERIGDPDVENRKFSPMTEVLLMEALKARGVEIKADAKKVKK